MNHLREGAAGGQTMEMLVPQKGAPGPSWEGGIQPQGQTPGGYSLIGQPLSC